MIHIVCNRKSDTAIKHHQFIDQFEPNLIQSSAKLVHRQTVHTKMRCRRTWHLIGVYMVSSSTPFLANNLPLKHESHRGWNQINRFDLEFDMSRDKSAYRDKSVSNNQFHQYNCNLWSTTLKKSFNPYPFSVLKMRSAFDVYWIYLRSLKTRRFHGSKQYQPCSDYSPGNSPIWVDIVCS